jgi:AcrR family transcriptional regulator
MATQSFFNLTEEKQLQIIDTCIEEFALYGYETASINRIVANTKVAKGSIYHYFESKNKLYLYLIELVENKKKLFLNDQLPKQKTFFKSLTNIMLYSMLFDLENPRYACFLQKLYNENNSNELGNVKAIHLKHSVENIASLIQSEKDIAKKIRKNTLLQAAFVVHTVSANATQYLELHYNFYLSDCITLNKVPFEINMQEIEVIAKQYSALLKKGLGA